MSTAQPPRNRGNSGVSGRLVSPQLSSSSAGLSSPPRSSPEAESPSAQLNPTSSITVNPSLNSAVSDVMSQAPARKKPGMSCHLGLVGCQELTLIIRPQAEKSSKRRQLRNEYGRAKSQKSAQTQGSKCAASKTKKEERFCRARQCPRSQGCRGSV